MSDVKLGKLVDGECGRDAVHVAVIPMIAHVRLKPGQRVGIISEGVAGPTSNNVGIVDPFLMVSVQKGFKFLLCLFPGSVTGMRHHWKHPAFEESTVKCAKNDGGDALYLQMRSESEEWLREYVKKVNLDDSPELAFHEFIGNIRENRMIFRGKAGHYYSDVVDAEELEMHVSRYLGIKIQWDQMTYSCSC